MLLVFLFAGQIEERGTGFLARPTERTGQEARPTLPHQSLNMARIQNSLFSVLTVLAWC